MVGGKVERTPGGGEWWRCSIKRLGGVGCWGGGGGGGNLATGGEKGGDKNDKLKPKEGLGGEGK